MNNNGNFDDLFEEVKNTYFQNKGRLLFHGWHHIHFVLSKSERFAKSIGADETLVKVAALLHDVNYVAIPGRESDPKEVVEYRKSILNKYGFDDDFSNRIEKIITEAHTGDRGAEISQEGAALSDADALFKVMPITPFLFSAKYMAQNNVDVFKWAGKIIAEQKPLVEGGIYFYTPIAKEKYTKWAEQNLKTIEIVQEALDDQDIQNVISDGKEMGVL
ncbi:MAG: hypothetical protein UX37_C0018G0009 [Microgenomates group bacterium GW2011_GWA2_46_16]|nr:MAG: hypothetical protein UX37_C0018G0009 [Microgenomates group bacterium GW2011_GWA2_46_16]